ncbi:MAG TPA: hypothetical protein VHG08_21225 [Longimicrobium sp.]|nr:hypothetical protein [Longimicrobium sp.]
MKHKLRIEELSVASFSTEEDGLARKRGTVRGFGDVSFSTCPGELTCDSCDDVRSCAGTCGCTERTCERTCDFTCYVSCPDRESCGQPVC